MAVLRKDERRRVAIDRQKLQCQRGDDSEAFAVREFVVFFAWQSDRPAKVTRSPIGDALLLVAKNITNDASMRTHVRIDSDTQGVLGHVLVIDTILEKIDVCDAFVPDLTFVAVTEDGKHVPNPNVLLEYGYALYAKTHSIMVMNTAYGLPEKLPFDMGHRRHPIKFHLPPTATSPKRSKAERKLSQELEKMLRRMIAATPAKPKDEKPFARAKVATPPAFFFKPSEVLAEFGIFESERQRYRFDSNKAIFLRLFPAYAGAARRRTGKGKGNIHRSKALSDVPDHRGALRRK
jgi:hypothetical protein